MSIKVITLVWDAFPSSGSELLAMLALADWCNDAGGSLHPSIAALAHKIRTSESQARRILRKLEEDNFIKVVGNHFGGAPGTTRQYCINIELLKKYAEHGDTGSADATRQSRHTGSTDASRQTDERASADATPSMDARDGSHGCARRVAPMRETGSTHATLTVIEPLIEPSIETSIPALPSQHGDEPATKGKEDKTQIAYREIWQAYSDAYQARYSVKPIRNAKVNAQVRQLHSRLGVEAVHVASFYVSINEAFIVKRMHDLSLLVAQAESIRTQWLTGRTMTATAARQVDQTQSNVSAANEAMRILKEKRHA